VTEPLSPFAWFLIVLWGLTCVLAVPRVIRLWRGEIEIFPRSMPSWRAYIRAAPLGLFAMMLAVVGTPLLALAGGVGAWPPASLGPDPSVPKVLLTLLVGAICLLFFVAAGLIVTVTLVNWPKVVVPPNMRNEPGLLHGGGRGAGRVRRRRRE